MDKTEARSILGVGQDAGSEEIETRYVLLLKKHRMETARLKDAINEAETPEEAKASEDAAEDLEAEFARITEAYKVLTGQDKKEEEEAPGKSSPLLKAVGVDEKKAKNFLYYYKYYILAGILLIIAIIYTVSSCSKRVVPDFNVAFVGRIGYYEAVDDLADSVRENLPMLGEPGFDGAYFDETIVGDQLYAMEMKLSVLFGAADMDVFILDRKYYDRFAKMGVFKNLDEIAPQLGVDISKNADLIVAIENVLDDMDGQDGISTDEGTGGGTADVPQEPHLYGIDVSDSTVLKEAGVIADDMVAAIFLGSDQQDKAEVFLRFLLE